MRLSASFRRPAKAAFACATYLLLAGCAHGPARPGGSATGPEGPRQTAAPSSSAVAAEHAPLALRPATVPSAATEPLAPAVTAREPPAPLHAASARMVSGSAGVVVTSEPNATRAGVAALSRGGNAADAVIAAAFALAVTYPSAGNLGGGGIILYRPRGGATVAIEFRERAPAAVTQAAFDRMIAEHALGPAAVGVPGTVAGLDLTLARYGKLSRREVMEAAISLARNGFSLGHNQSDALKWSWPALSKDPLAKRVFGGAKGPKHEGERVVQPELATTLELIAEKGDEGFYQGPTADQLAALSSRGGLISRDDLATYRAAVREPLRTRYHGFVVETAPPPSGGGPALAALLGLLDHEHAERFPATSADELHVFAEAARRAQTIRRFDVVDPDSVPGYDLAAQEAEWLDPARLLSRLSPIDMKRATPSRAVHPLYDVAVKELEHTTHLAAVDAEGNVASCTTTLSASFGAKVMAAGMVLNDSLAAFGSAGASTQAPRRRMPTSMSPTLVLAGSDPVLVLGTPGGDTIPNTVARVLRGVVDYGMSLDRAVDAPRIHHGFVPDELRYEGAHPPPKAVLAELSRRGHRLSAKTRSIGDANSITVERGVAYAYADPRGGGLAEAAERGVGSARSGEPLR